MKKGLFIFLAAAATFICLMSCENPVMKTWWEEQEIAENGVVDGSNNGKVDPVIRWPKYLKAIYGQKLSDIALPCNCTTEETHGTFTWTKPDTSFSKARKQTYTMTFTPDDTSHYNVITKDAEITVLVINMVKIPAGTFMMGSPVSEYGRMSEEDLHQVNLNGFYMSEYIVTQELYDFVRYNNTDIFFDVADDDENELLGQLPATGIDWYDTLVICNKLSMMMGLTPAYSINGSTDPADWGKIPTVENDYNSALWENVKIVPGSNGYRLPTEAQWEYACRAGTTTAYYTGDTFSNDTGWYPELYPFRHKVGLKPANAWGLYDMHGNVWEWCWDLYDENYYSKSPLNNPMGPSSGTEHIMRGGAIDSFPLELLRSASRFHNYPYQRLENYSLRLVRP